MVPLVTLNCLPHALHFHSGRQRYSYTARQPQAGQTGSPPVACQRSARNRPRASSSPMRATAVTLSVLAAALRRKCWATYVFVVFLTDMYDTKSPLARGKRTDM